MSVVVVLHREADTVKGVELYVWQEFLVHFYLQYSLHRTRIHTFYTYATTDERQGRDNLYEKTAKSVQPVRAGTPYTYTQHAADNPGGIANRKANKAPHMAIFPFPPSTPVLSARQSPPAALHSISAFRTPTTTSAPRRAAAPRLPPPSRHTSLTRLRFQKMLQLI